MLPSGHPRLQGKPADAAPPALQTTPLLSLLTGTPTTPGDPNNKVVSTCPNPGNYLWW